MRKVCVLCARCALVIVARATVVKEIYREKTEAKTVGREGHRNGATTSIISETSATVVVVCFFCERAK